MALPACPSPPIYGCKFVTEETYRVVAPSIPAVTSGMPTYHAGVKTLELYIHIAV